MAGRRLAPALILAGLMSAGLRADTELTLRKSAENSISVWVASTDSVGGLQFCLNTRGGAVLCSIRSIGRILGSGWDLRSYLKNDTTLSVVILAPFRKALPAGDGPIVEVAYTMCPVPAETASVFFSNCEVADVSARRIHVSAVGMSWCNRGRDEFQLLQNYPNPFNASSQINYSLRKEAFVQLAVYDISGRLIESLVSERQPAGAYGFRWTAKLGLASGTYLVRLRVNAQMAVSRIVMIK